MNVSCSGLHLVRKLLAMKTFTSLLLTTLFVNLSSTAFGQPILERLEQRVRGLVDQPGAEAQAGAQEPGYLGVIADDRQDVGRGVRLREVVAGGPAEKSGLKAGDLVTQVNGMAIKSMDDFGQQVSKLSPGAKLTFEVQRDNQAQRIEVTLGRRPPPAERRFERFGQIPADQPAQAPRPAVLGVRALPVTPELQRLLGLADARGALVAEVLPDTPADRSGLPSDVVILALDGKRVENPADLSRLVMEAGPGKEVTLSYFGQGKLSEQKVTLGDAGGQQQGPLAPGAPNLLPGQPNQPPVVVEGPRGDRQEILEARIRELEQRVSELEKKLNEKK
jgi:predicted metalloprotease with PDZ domain